MHNLKYNTGGRLPKQCTTTSLCAAAAEGTKGTKGTDTVRVGGCYTSRPSPGHS